MVRPLSNDLRERVVAAVIGGESCQAVSARFGVAVSSVVKWSQRPAKTEIQNTRPVYQKNASTICASVEFLDVQDTSRSASQ